MKWKYKLILKKYECWINTVDLEMIVESAIYDVIKWQKIDIGKKKKSIYFSRPIAFQKQSMAMSSCANWKWSLNSSGLQQ